MSRQHMRGILSHNVQQVARKKSRRRRAAEELTPANAINILPPRTRLMVQFPSPGQMAPIKVQETTNILKITSPSFLQGKDS